MKIRFKALTIFGLVISVLIAGSIIFAVSRKTSKVEKTSNNSSQIPTMSQEKNLQDKQNTSSPSVQNQQLPKNLPKDVNAINLNPVENSQAIATAVAVQDKENFILIIETTLSDPPPEENYSVWLVKKGTDENLLLGQLKKMGNKYAISTTQKGSISDYQQLLITQEAKNDNLPEKRIFEGAFQT